MRKSGLYSVIARDHKPKCSSIGQGGRGRKTKISMSTMNKSRKKSHKAYRGQGR